MEQMLGHITHHQNLARRLEQSPEFNIAPCWMPIQPKGNDFWERMPIVRGNWSLKASLRAREALYTALNSQPLDVLFFHTQTTALFAPVFLKKRPGIISLDATPINYDSVGEAYNHIPSKNSWIERRKFLWHQEAFQSATHLVTWCHWAKDSLVKDYGIPTENVTVIPPGVDLNNWSFGLAKAQQAQEIATQDRPIRLLFVGGDFARKGGHYLVQAFRDRLQGRCELDIVTRDAEAETAIAGLSGARVHRGLTPNSEPLKKLYAEADVFVFPSIGDCLPIALMEAMAAGLPIISTDVGALREEVEDGVNGYIIPPKNAEAVGDAAIKLLEDRVKLGEMSAAGRRIAEERFDAHRNYGEILNLLKTLKHHSA